jgi:hypothetical protein
MASPPGETVFNKAEPPPAACEEFEKYSTLSPPAA